MGPRVVVIDNYDSFVYNLVQYLGELGASPVVVRNDAIRIEDLAGEEPEGFLISPGPGRPEDAGVSSQVIERYGRSGIPVLGVCLGHQCIGSVFGANIVRSAQIMHGKTSIVQHDGKGVFHNLENPIVATRYHSLVIEPESVPDCLEVSASTADGTIMGVRHRELPVEGVQFHPESILTRAGHELLSNFLRRCNENAKVSL